MAVTEAPTETPNWAKDAAIPQDLVAPEPAKQDAGWAFLNPVPHQHVNWFWNLVSQWLQFLSATNRVFNDLGTAIAFVEDPTNNAGVGDLLTVFEDDSANGPGITQATLGTAAGFSSGYVDASGDVVAIADGSVDPRLFKRDLSTLIATLARTNSGVNNVIRTDGNTTVVGYDVFVEAFNIAGVSLWVFDLGTVVAKDLCMSDGDVYVVHEITTAAGDVVADRHLHKLLLANGTIVWDYQHSTGGALRSVCTNGRQVFVGGDASTFASLATVRAVGANSGSDAAGEGGNGVNVDGFAWDSAQAPIGDRVMDSDGLLLYIGGSDIVSQQLVAVGQAEGDLAWAYVHPDATQKALHVSVDQTYVYATYGDNSGAPNVGFMRAHDKRTGVPSWQFGAPSGGGVAAGVCTVSDGQAVWYLGGVDDNNLRRLTRWNVPTQFRVIDAATEFVKFRNWKLQSSDQ